MGPYIYEIYFHIILKTIWRPLQLLNADKGGCFFLLFCFVLSSGCFGEVFFLLLLFCVWVWGLLALLFFLILRFIFHSCRFQGDFEILSLHVYCQNGEEHCFSASKFILGNF